jgi:hypothetical protein
MVTAASDRVRMTVSFRRRGSGHAKWDSSTLEIDGEQAALSEGYDHLLQIFADPDGHAGGATLPPIPDAGDPDSAPGLVQQTYSKLTGAFPGATAGYDAVTRRWVIGADVPGGGLRFYFTSTSLGWTLDRRQPLRIVLGGKDVSRQAGGDIAKALRMLTTHGEPQQGTGPVHGASPVHGRPKGVEVRNTTVIRN